MERKLSHFDLEVQTGRTYIKPLKVFTDFEYELFGAFSALR